MLPGGPRAKLATPRLMAGETLSSWPRRCSCVTGPSGGAAGGRRRRRRWFGAAGRLRGLRRGARRAARRASRGGGGAVDNVEGRAGAGGGTAWTARRTDCRRRRRRGLDDGRADARPAGGGTGALALRVAARFGPDPCMHAFRGRARLVSGLGPPVPWRGCAECAATSLIALPARAVCPRRGGVHADGPRPLVSPLPPPSAKRRRCARRHWVPSRLRPGEQCPGPAPRVGVGRGSFRGRVSREAFALVGRACWRVGMAA